MKLRCLAPAIAAALAAAPLLADEAKPVDNTPKLAYGQMLKQGDKILFAPCRDRSYLLLEDVSTGGAVIQGLNVVGLAAGKKLYAELFAVVEGNALKASALNLARTDGRCQQPGSADEAWRAAGNEPGWALAAGGEQVLLKRQGKPDVSVPYAPFKMDGKAAQYEAARDNHKLAVRFDPVLCRDPAAESVFGWTAAVNLDGQVLKGCAWQR